MPAIDTRQVEELRDALSQPLPRIPTRYFYDNRGARLFDTITRLPEYYQTRTEEGILEACAADVVGRVRPLALAELGSGVGRKIRMVLDAMQRAGRMDSCLFFDINEQLLSASIIQLRSLYPGLEVRGVLGDFETDLDRLGPGGERLILFLAGTIGNLPPERLPAFLGALRRQMAPGDGLLVGLDLVKDPRRLEAAYNDAQGVTAEFNLNMLEVVNKRFDADFDVQAFQHRAFWDAENEWIEMRLRARRPSRARVHAADITLEFAAGDEIRTELSRKFTRESFTRVLQGTGLSLGAWYTDDEELFALALVQPG
jgi:L-histidine N-alpha-methyltransferase